jgi:hypothetical protein
MTLAVVGLDGRISAREALGYAESHVTAASRAGPPGPSCFGLNSLEGGRRSFLRAFKQDVQALRTVWYS